MINVGIPYMDSMAYVKIRSSWCSVGEIAQLATSKKLSLLIDTRGAEAS